MWPRPFSRLAHIYPCGIWMFVQSRKRFICMDRFLPLILFIVLFVSFNGRLFLLLQCPCEYFSQPCGIGTFITESIQQWQVRGFSIWSAWLILVLNFGIVTRKKRIWHSTLEILSVKKWQWTKNKQMWLEKKFVAAFCRDDVQLTSSRLCRL